ncbi:uncharacterized protein LOC17875816 [Capsella rubella]|uniref:uncharacterized protein LOC17875816 n=1 Tax=Capsella rubella TaxID=81985 RepID=UPI000CD4C2E1|nr:uncharacterized protein LOC17875816 [Capsella rubella]
MYKQPSLQHPLLKNHKIQVRPSNEVLAMISKDASLEEELSNNEAVAEFDIPGEGCPQGQVPIHKPRNLFNNTEKHFYSNYGTLGEHAAIVRKHDPSPSRGASAWVSIYEPKVTKDQFSMTIIELHTNYGDEGERTSAQIGWAVNPPLYGDHRSRLTAYWTPDAMDNGCYNVQCKGFVQVDRKLYLGASFQRTSVVGGKQYKGFFALHQDRKTNNLLVSYMKTYIGYWPGEILPYLENGAKEVVYGGFTYTPSENMHPWDVVSPPMGNGRKPLDEEVGLSHTCYMHSVRHVTQDYISVDIDTVKFVEDADVGRCYDVIIQDPGKYGQMFTFGGPGGYCE